MERILSAPRWALVAVVATFTLAVAALVTGLSGPAHAGPPPAAANAAIQGQHLNGDENGEDDDDDEDDEEIQE